jgi:hypothetical protein
MSKKIVKTCTDVDVIKITEKKMTIKNTLNVEVKRLTY